LKRLEPLVRRGCQPSMLNLRYSLRRLSSRFHLPFSSAFTFTSRMQRLSRNSASSFVMRLLRLAMFMYLPILKRITVKQMVASPHTVCVRSNSVVVLESKYVFLESSFT
jgi:hypothetical protein